MEQTCKGNGGIDSENTCEATYVMEIVVGLVLVHGFEIVWFALKAERGKKGQNRGGIVV